MELNESVKNSQLFRLYGKLLTQKQQDCLQLYCDYNTTLSEIADIYNCSRQAVYDFIKNAVKTLNDYEEKLHLYQKQIKANELLQNLNANLNEQTVKELKDLWEID